MALIHGTEKHFKLAGTVEDMLPHLTEDHPNITAEVIDRTTLAEARAYLFEMGVDMQYSTDEEIVLEYLHEQDHMNNETEDEQGQY